MIHRGDAVADGVDVDDAPVRLEPLCRVELGRDPRVHPFHADPPGEAYPRGHADGYRVAEPSVLQDQRRGVLPPDSEPIRRIGQEERPPDKGAGFRFDDHLRSAGANAPATSATESALTRIEVVVFMTGSSDHACSSVPRRPGRPIRTARA